MRFTFGTPCCACFENEAWFDDPSCPVAGMRGGEGWGYIVHFQVAVRCGGCQRVCHASMIWYSGYKTFFERFLP